MLLVACDERPKPAPAAVDLPTANLGLPAFVDAGIQETDDPPPPAGDLKRDLDTFVNVDACVKARANLDPLVGDALRAIGYETFLRDACRMLEATKDKKRETCDRIDASAMRTRCQMWVAMAAESPDRCPLQFEGLPSRGRHASCVAISAKDPRLCAAEAGLSARAMCEALTLRDASRCDALAPSPGSARANCQREFTRWKELLHAPLSGLAALPTPHGKLSVKGESGTPDPTPSETDLSAEYTHGGVVVTGKERARVELGLLGESDTSRIAPSPHRRARFGVSVILNTSPLARDAKPLLERFELEVPGEATVVYPGVPCDCRLTSTRVDSVRGGEIALAITGTIHAGLKSYRIDWNAVTFVRDVVDEAAVLGHFERSVIPTPHPTLRSFFDAGK
jgi:hypothetical protein